MKKPVIAIDGPAGSGKSTIAKLLSKKYSINYLNSGAMYRAVTYKVLRDFIDIYNREILDKFVDTIELKIEFQNEVQKTIINGEDVSDKIYTEEVAKKVSEVSAISTIRAKINHFLREFAGRNGVIMEGRDIGTKVLVDADYKIFISASLDERALRRSKEYSQMGHSVNYEEVRDRIASRDDQDSHRACDPLKKADDAFEIDTTGLSLDDVVSKIMKFISERND